MNLKSVAMFTQENCWRPPSSSVSQWIISFAGREIITIAAARILLIKGTVFVSFSTISWSYGSVLWQKEHPC